jgi:uncharacterized protein (TIRG00374 family)
MALSAVSVAGHGGWVRWVRILAVAAVVLVTAVVVWANREELPAAGRALRGAQPGWLAGGAVLLIGWWGCWVLLHLASRRAAGLRVDSDGRRLVPVTLAAVALNLVVKSGGLAGLAVFAADGRRRGLAAARVQTGYLLATALAEVGFTVILAGAVVLSAVDGRLTRVEVAATAVFVVLLAVRGALVIAALRSRDALLRVWSLPAVWWSRLRRRPVRAVGLRAVDELYDAMSMMLARPAATLPAAGFAVGIDVAGAGLLWTSLAAVGGGNRPVVALTAYAMSVLFGIVGVVPGGLGVVELGAAAVLVSFGAPVGVAGAAVLVFRLWEFWVPLALGGMLAARVRRTGVARTGRTGTS